MHFITCWRFVYVPAGQTDFCTFYCRVSRFSQLTSFELFVSQICNNVEVVSFKQPLCTVQITWPVCCPLHVAPVWNWLKQIKQTPLHVEPDGTPSCDQRRKAGPRGDGRRQVFFCWCDVEELKMGAAPSLPPLSLPCPPSLSSLSLSVSLSLSLSPFPPLSPPSLSLAPPPPPNSLSSPLFPPLTNRNKAQKVT